MCPTSTPPTRYSEEEKRVAIEYLLSHRRNFTATVRELGYPASRYILHRWYLQYLKGHEISAHYQGRSSYSIEERERAVKYYIEHHVSVKEAVRTLGYPTHNTLYEWLKEDAPDVFYTRACHHNGRLLKCSQEEVKEAVIELCQTHDARAVATKYEVTKCTLSDWKQRFLSTATVKCRGGLKVTVGGTTHARQCPG